MGKIEAEQHVSSTESSGNESARNEDDILKDFTPGQLNFGEAGDLWGFHMSGVAVMAREKRVYNDDDEYSDMFELHVTVSGKISFDLQFQDQLSRRTFVKVLDKVAFSFNENAIAKEFCRPMDLELRSKKNLHEAINHMREKVTAQSRETSRFAIKMKEHITCPIQERPVCELLAVVGYDAERDAAYINVISAVDSCEHQ